MCTRKKTKEVPVQNFSKIKQLFLPSVLSGGPLFTDLSFPPDQSSLTYVYSGDDKYEKMVFKRPLEITSQAVLTGVGGVHDAQFPWSTWKKSGWFEAAVSVVSLSIRHMDRLIPGYRNFEQSLQSEYIGAFHFHVWRFGEAIDIVVDDYLPTYNNSLLYCPAYGSPKEFWGPLVEKAYAKCKKTYEAIESGNTLDALTDLTGAICEFYTPDVNPAENLFHVLYKSSVNRSLIVCWRNNKRLTPTGFMFRTNNDKERSKNDGITVKRYLHIVTASTKFPLTDGRLVQMIRLKCPFTEEPGWNGKFSDSDDISWRTVNSEFYGRYKPQFNKDPDEYWMTFEDFRCNFGGLIICSDSAPYRTEGMNIDRCYRRLSDEEIKPTQKTVTVFQERKPVGKRQARYSVPAHYLKSKRSSIPEVHEIEYSHRHRESVPRQFLAVKCASKTGQEIQVKETGKTLKIDNTYRKAHRKYTSSHTKWNLESNESNHTSGYRRIRHEKYSQLEAVPATRRKESKIPSVSYNQSDVKIKNDDETGASQGRSGSLTSNCSLLSQCPSTFSASDITVHFQNSCVLSRDDSLKRPRSAPGNGSSSGRRTSSGSLPNVTVSNFLATTSDHFQSHGSWKQVIDYKGCWEKNESSVLHSDLYTHQRNPRIHLDILQPDAINQIVAPEYHGKSHVVISLLQDYRHGSSTANSLLVSIGFSLYRCKNPTKDEKRPLKKLPLVERAGPTREKREIIQRFDLEPGSYFIVPYCLCAGHTGEYMVRVLTERDPVAGKTGCVVS